MKYRTHRGGFDESMRTMVEVHSMKELLSHINEVYPQKYTIDSVIFNHVGYDERCGWDTYYVIGSIYGGNVVLGMSDGIMVKYNESRQTPEKSEMKGKNMG